jgi:hypothetical protein
LITAVVLAWLGLAWALSWLMGRRGHERGAWWTLAILMGPAAVPLAVLELLAPLDRRAVLLERGQVLDGDLSVLVQVDATAESRDPASAAHDLLAPWLRRLCLVRVLPEGGPRLMEELAAQELRQQSADWAPGAGLALVFGRPDTALCEYATSEGYGMLVLGSPNRATTQALRAAGVAVLEGASGVERMSACGHLGARRVDNNQSCARTASVDRRQTRRSGHHVLQESAS